MPKYFVLPENITGDTIVITGEDAKHLATVLRSEEGDCVEVCDGCGTDYCCEITAVDKKEVTLKISEKSPCQSEPKTKITLFQGLPKADKMELIIQKCVELGVEKIVPVATHRAVVKLDKKDSLKKIERWQKIAESAAKQSGRGIIPQIGEVVTFKEAVKFGAMAQGAIIPYEHEEKRGIREFVKGFSGSEVAIFIGPEGGFADEEIALAMENGILSVTLGKRILRTETAGMATVAILLYELG
ncbi:MAG: 16S rRNA (uracil(1498)-N(3))-methyltransferase [Lachnospiraceae bacterium]|nr:16S rRNA (uracil(1498)-N(3))-methyltransferase [Lachnospiraceae bacterium]